ncbi:MAG: hypothetical protein LAT82_05765 [Nanoarchaeota archaeon]|nr:hypothetical protein [Nanoarchaeota archaeon]
MSQKLEKITQEIISNHPSYGFVPESNIVDLSQIPPVFAFEATFRQYGQKDIVGVDVFYPENGFLKSCLGLFNVEKSSIPDLIENSPKTIPKNSRNDQTLYFLTGILPQGFRGIARNYMFQDFEASLHFNPLRNKEFIRAFQKDAGITIIDIGDFPNGYVQ